jgi:predicted metalloenzyme YecM
MKTTVEWLIEELEDNGINLDLASEIIKQAKEMEKEQIEDAWENGIENCGEFNNPTIISGKQYYNETFKSE